MLPLNYHRNWVVDRLHDSTAAAKSEGARPTIPVTWLLSFLRKENAKRRSTRALREKKDSERLGGTDNKYREGGYRGRGTDNYLGIHVRPTACRRTALKTWGFRGR